MPDPLNNPSGQSSQPASARQTSQVLERNVRALVEHAAEAERARTTGDRVASAVSHFAGTMNFVYFHLIAFGLWAAVDLGWVPGIRNFDPSFTILGTFASCEAIFLATFVLIAQNRMSSLADTRNHLDLQVSLLTEHETTHILRLVAAMSDRMGVGEALHPEIQELVRDVAPQDMLDRIEVHTDAVEREIREDSAPQSNKRE